jgi:hypothetical protein
LVFLRQPVLKPVACGIGIRQRRVVAVVFIVDLLCGDKRVAAIALSHCPRDATAFVAVAHVAEIIVAARPETARTPLRVNVQHVGHLIDQPARRGGGGVPITTFRPAWPSVSTARSSQP